MKHKGKVLILHENYGVGIHTKIPGRKCESNFTLVNLLLLFDFLRMKFQYEQNLSLSLEKTVQTESKQIKTNTEVFQANLHSIRWDARCPGNETSDN